MMEDIRRQMDAYHAWLRDKSTLRQVEDWVEITTPYLDRHNDYLQIYAKRFKGGTCLRTTVTRSAISSRMAARS